MEVMELTSWGTMIFMKMYTRNTRNISENSADSACISLGCCLRLKNSGCITRSAARCTGPSRNAMAKPTRKGDASDVSVRTKPHTELKL